MKFPRAISVGAAAFVAAATANVAAAADTDANFRQLQASDPDTRIEALRELQTSIDPRLPDALLTLLRDEGNSIRRLAARGIGSRWWQIPKNDTAKFVTAVKTNAASSEEDEKNMALRAIALLTRRYDSEMTLRSASGRWVLYERHNLPCLIDTTTETEELLGWSPDEERRAWVASSWGNGPLKPSVFWHGSRELVAIEMLLNRKESNVWTWQHGKGVRKITTARMAKAAGVRDAQIYAPGGIFIEIKQWAGDQLRFDFTYSTRRGDDFIDHTAQLAWNSRDDTLQILSQKTN